MYTVKAVFEGEAGLFCSPIHNVERFSYPCPTISAARGMMETILYHPEFRFEVYKISILHPIKRFNIRVNETTECFNPKGGFINTCKTRTQRNQYVLDNPSFLIEAKIILTEKGKNEVGSTGKNTPEKFVAMFNRMLKKGQGNKVTCMGQKELIAFPRVATEDDKPIEWNEVVYNLLYDSFNLDTKKPFATYFDAKIVNGVIDVPSWESIKLGGQNV
jgi:CRISPR-associated protein Cas5d